MVVFCKFLAENLKSKQKKINFITSKSTVKGFLNNIGKDVMNNENDTKMIKQKKAIVKSIGVPKKMKDDNCCIINNI
jgi:hypothetical protein